MFFRLYPQGIATIRSVTAHVSAIVGDLARLECEGKNLRDVAWYHKWASIGKSSKYQIVSTNFRSMLIIADVKLTDSGLYQCRSGFSATATVQLTVKMPVLPRITLHPRDISSAKGTRVELFCRAIGHPPVTIYWVKKHGQRELYIPNNGSLTFSAVSDRNTGIYQCIAENGRGSARSAYATVTVENTGIG